MGRAPRKMEYIENKRACSSTYIKRKKGLVKKAWEFSTLCGIDVCMIIYGPKHGNTNQLKIWPDDTDEFSRITNRYLKICSDERYNRAQDLSDYFKERQRRIEIEIAKLRNKNIQLKYHVSEDFVKRISVDDLSALVTKLDAKIGMVMMKLESLHSNLQGNGLNEASFVPNVQYFNPCQELFNRNMEPGGLNQQQSFSSFNNFDMEFPVSYYPPVQSSHMMLPPDPRNHMAMLPNNGNICAHFGEGSSRSRIQYTSMKDQVQCDPTSSYLDALGFNMQMTPSNVQNGLIMQQTGSANGMRGQEDDITGLL